MKRARKGEMGMGTLIIFIAMILVAAVAASVLISTTGALQNKALATGRATTSEVGTSIHVMEVYAEDGSNQQVDYLYESVKLSAGSGAIRFSDTLMSLNLNDQTADYEYNSSVDCTNTSTTTAGGDFGVEYLINGSNNQAGYLVKGDVARVCIQSPRTITEGEEIKLSLIPMVGHAVVTETSTPDLMIDTRITVFP
ncbi:MAG: hypothetical protein OXR66_05595 [Candidatus Woesearchaeota archaeon]|nr:hypothetical protein [Candidatus Woesearchaeota archaeon]